MRIGSAMLLMSHTERIRRNTRMRQIPGSAAKRLDRFNARQNAAERLPSLGAAQFRRSVIDPSCRSRSQPRSRGCCGLRWVALRLRLLRSRFLRLLARVFRLWPARRRNCPGRRPDGRFTGRSLRRRGWSCLCSGEFGAFLQPRLIILRCIDDQCAFHSVMAKSAQLAANHFIAPGLDWSEPNRNERTGNRVTGDSHARSQKKS